WVRKIQVDLQMAPSEWPRFTDFGVTLLDADGRQIAKSPLNYAFGRLETELPQAWSGGPVTLALFPGWAVAGQDQVWSVDAVVRLYGGDSSAVALVPAGDAAFTLAPAQADAVTFVPQPPPWALPDGFVPLLLYTATVDRDDAWTRESPLLPAPTPLMR
ncbi:MAG TPA: hypothetical protein VFI13_12195, partial [Gemmatimonadales bacterium]|nr:hypothetical protein [Gemmatimonadales bacterium]